MPFLEPKQVEELLKFFIVCKKLRSAAAEKKSTDHSISRISNDADLSVKTIEGSVSGVIDAIDQDLCQHGSLRVVLQWHITAYLEERSDVAFYGGASS